MCRRREKIANILHDQIFKFLGGGTPGGADFSLLLNDLVKMELYVLYLQPST